MHDFNPSDLSIETKVSIGYTNDPGSERQIVTVTTKLYWRDVLISESEGEDYVDG